MKTLELAVELKVMEQCPGGPEGCEGGEHKGYLVELGSGYQGIPNDQLPEALAALVAELVAQAVARIAREDPELESALRARVERADFVAEADPAAPSIAETERVFGETSEG